MNGYAYVKERGLMIEGNYAYKGVEQSCQYDETKVAVRISGVYQYEKSPEGMKRGLTIGPISMSLHASADSFRSYKGGIYNDISCPTNTNHAVQAVGWGREGNQLYFIMRNSWGATWGDQGYMKIEAIQSKDRPLGICGMFYR